MYNKFNIKYLEKIFNLAKKKNYNFISLEKLYDLKGDIKKKFVLRLDVEYQPHSLENFIKIAKKFKVPMTIYVRVAGPYNFFWYNTFKYLKKASNDGHEIGLHTTPYEWGKLNKQKSNQILDVEVQVIKSFFNLKSISTHRDLNYTYNSLPWFEKNWLKIKKKYKLKYHAYDKKLFQKVQYVNEGFNPHLCWRNKSPEECISKGESIYMLLHPHWWYEDNPFEHEYSN